MSGLQTICSVIPEQYTPEKSNFLQEKLLKYMQA